MLNYQHLHANYVIIHVKHVSEPQLIVQFALPLMQLIIIIIISDVLHFALPNIIMHKIQQTLAFNVMMAA
jgi:hypothetical protein